MYGFDRLEDYLARGGRLTQAEYDFYNKENGWQDAAYYYGGDAEALFAAVKEDFFAGRIGARRVVADRWSVDIPDEYLSFSSDKQAGGYIHYATIGVSGTATSTLAALEKLAPAADSGQPDTQYGTDALKITLS